MSDTARANAKPKAPSAYLNTPTGTEQERRVFRLLRLTAEAKAKGQSICSIRLADLEALILIAAARDAALVQS